MSKSRGFAWCAGVILTLALGAAPASAADSVSRSFDFSPGDLLVIDVHKGHVDVRTGGSHEVTVTVKVERGSVEDHVDLRFEEAGGLEIIGRKPDENRRGAGEGRGVLSRLFGDDDDDGIEYEIVAPRRMDLEVSSGGGHISVQDVEGRANIRTGGGHVEIRDTGGELTVSTGGGHIEIGNVDGPLSVKTGGGHVSVDDVRGDVEAETGGGHVSIGEVEGDVAARTGGGHITVDRVDGRMELESGGGSVKVRAGSGDAKISTGGGNVTLREMEGHVRVRTEGGDVAVALGRGNERGADLETEDGSIEVRVPRGTGFDLEAEARYGEVDVVSLDLDASRRSSRGRLEGVIGRGGSPLRLYTGDGDIRITGD